MSDVIPVGLTPQEAVDFFRRKGFAIGFHWQDILAAEHAKVFTVAKMMRVDLLETVRQALDAAIAKGTTLQQFQKDLTPILQQAGWWDQQKAIDPLTGNEQVVQLGSPRRLETIYDANLRTSYSAGHWQQIEQTKASRPYLRYIHHASSHPRQQHAQWNNLVLRADDPFWHTHFPPNGWFCHCTAQQLNERDLGRYNLTLAPTSPTITTVTYTNARTGQTIQVPEGIDPGFGFNAGMVSLDTYRQQLADRIAAAPADLRQALAS